MFFDVHAVCIHNMTYTGNFARVVLLRLSGRFQDLTNKQTCRWSANHWMCLSKFTDRTKLNLTNKKKKFSNWHQEVTHTKQYFEIAFNLGFGVMNFFSFPLPCVTCRMNLGVNTTLVVLVFWLYPLKCNVLFFVCCLDRGKGFVDVLDAQWQCEGELIPLELSVLKPREFLVYQHGLFLMHTLHKLKLVSVKASLSLCCVLWNN